MSKITESKNKISQNIDSMKISDILNIINDEDKKVPLSISNHLNEIERIIIDVVHSFNNEGRLFYVGCGTSGRIGVLDASECHPTFSVSYDMVQGIIAGGKTALYKSIEGAEDSFEDGFNSLKDKKITSNDSVIGISANGEAPFVLGALNYAFSISASTSLISFNELKKKKFVKNNLSIIVGPEIITGSTRMKAGTATKLILNMISTTAMIKMNKTYSNYMVDLKISNNKLQQRGIRIISEITGVDTDSASLLLKKANKNVKAAIVMKLTGLSYEETIKKLSLNNGNLRDAIK